MSDGDVIRLNRMYKCGPAFNTGDNPPAQPKSTTAEGESTSREIENPRHETVQAEIPKLNQTLFGIFIFKIIPWN